MAFDKLVFPDTDSPIKPKVSPELTTRLKNSIIEDDVVIIEINCRRTKIKSTLITLYWLCGYALDQHNLFYSDIRVILNIQQKQVETLVTIAKGEDVIKLSQLKSSEYSSFSNFLDKLEVYRKQD